MVSRDCTLDRLRVGKTSRISSMPDFSGADAAAAAIVAALGGEWRSISTSSN